MSKNAFVSNKILLKMLGFALIEIRASEDIEIVNSLADIFHSLPSGLITDWDSEDGTELYSLIIGKAKKWKLESYILELKELSESSLK